MKKRLAVLAACSTLVFSFGAAAPAFADNGPHVAGAGVVADGCASCHRVHTAKAGSLLKQAQPGLCYTCHGSAAGGASTDVVDGLGYSDSTHSGTPAPGALRGGGFSKALINSAAPTGQSADTFNTAGIIPVLGAGVATTSSHSVDGSSQTAWGNGTTGAGAGISLTCGSCHDPHGNGNYRILKPVPDQSGVATINGVSIAEPATVPPTAKVYTTANYWQVAAANAPGYIANVSAWCTTCHTRYLSSDGGANTGDAIYTYRHKSNATTAGGPSCIQCHVSHGSNASMGTVSNGVTNPDGSTATGDSRLLRIDNRGTCQMCHNR
ncbi:MAG: cytochrome c3 family protein [Dermatophilaceae bacterium]